MTNYKSPRTSVKAPSRGRKILLYGLGLLIIVAAVIAVLELTNTTFLLHKRPVIPHTASPYTKGEPLQQTGTSSSENPAATSKSPDTNQQVAPDQPTGNFVSSHHASLSEAGNQSSSCNTTPGASCIITFTKGNTVKSLATKTADQGGAAYWNWTPQDAGLTSGSWTVQATAKLGNQTSTATDAMELQITE